MAELGARRRKGVRPFGRCLAVALSIQPARSRSEPAEVLLGVCACFSGVRRLS